jgi:dTDP-4-dehydrorhamnose 3,5-epimerase-like enzyme
MQRRQQIFVLVADSRAFIILDNVAHNIQKVGKDSLYVHSANVEYTRDSIFGTYHGDYEVVFWDVIACNLMDT